MKKDARRGRGGRGGAGAAGRLTRLRVSRPRPRCFDGGIRGLLVVVRLLGLRRQRRLGLGGHAAATAAQRPRCGTVRVAAAQGTRPSANRRSKTLTWPQHFKRRTHRDVVSLALVSAGAVSLCGSAIAFRHCLPTYGSGVWRCTKLQVGTGGNGSFGRTGVKWVCVWKKQVKKTRLPLQLDGFYFQIFPKKCGFYYLRM